jgi:O-antigen/teichoic acid export membrane protein
MEIMDQFPERQTESETADFVGHFDKSDRYRLVSQGALNYSAQIASTLSSLVLVPFMLLRLGAEAYGFWIFTLTIPAFASGIDSALYLSITRETASHSDVNRVTDDSTTSFLTASCGVYGALGLACGMFIVAAGSLMMPKLHLSASVQSAAPTVFWAVAIAFAAGRTVTFANAVLAGFQRFGTMNAITVAALIFRFSGFSLLLLRHCTLAAIAVWYTVVALMECLLALSIAHRLGAVRADRSLLQWRRLSRTFEFGLSSFLTTELFNLCSFSPPVLAGILTGGARATMALYAGQRPCFIVSELNWRGAEVLFSASAAEEKRKGNAAYSDLVVFGTTYLLAVAMPLCIGLFILAPVLVSAWLQNATPGIATVMRLTSIGVIADALWVGPLHVLWGRGLANRVLVITACVAASALLLNFLLIPRFGAPGSALAFTVSAWIGAIITTINATSGTNSSWLRFLASSFSDLVIPSASLTMTVLVVSSLLSQYPRLELLAAIICGGVVYTLSFWIQQPFRKTTVNPLFRLIGKTGKANAVRK